MKSFSKKEQPSTNISAEQSIDAADMNMPKPKKAKQQKYKAETIFCVVVFAYPILQWLLIYLYCNLESVLQAFQYFDRTDGKYHFFELENLFFNFKQIINQFKQSTDSVNLGSFIANGAIFYIISLLITLPVNQLCAFVIVKKMPAYKTMKFLLFMPNILSSMVMVLLLRQVVERGLVNWLPFIPTNVFDSPEKGVTVAVVLFTEIFLGFGGSIVLNTATMGRVPDELVEAGRIDGLRYVGEYWHIYLPIIYPVLEMTMLGVFVGFLNYMGPLFTLYGWEAPKSITTLGYYLYNEQVKVTSNTVASLEITKVYQYGYAATWNLLVGLISVPIVFATRKFLDRLDPNRET